MYLDRREHSVFDRRTFARGAMAVAVTAVLASLGARNAIAQEAIWVPKDIITEGSPLVSRDGRAGGLGIQPTASPEDILPGVPFRLELEMAVNSLDGENPNLPGGFMMDGVPFRNYGPDTRRFLVYRRITEGIHMEGLIGTRPTDWKRFMDDTDAVKLYFEVAPDRQDINVGLEVGQVMDSYRMGEPIMDPNRVGRLYLAAYSNPGVESVIRRLVIAQPQ